MLVRRNRQRATKTCYRARSALTQMVNDQNATNNKHISGILITTTGRLRIPGSSRNLPVGLNRALERDKTIDVGDQVANCFKL